MGALRSRERRAAPPARRGRLVLGPRRSGSRRTRCSATVIPNKHIIKGNFVWDLPDLRARRRRAEGARPGDQRLAALGRVDGVDGGVPPAARYNVGYSYYERRQQRQHHRIERLRRRASASSAIPAAAAASDMYRQFNAAAFQGPLTNSDGLESPAGYLRGCFQSALDLSIARNIRLGGARNLQLRVDMFNAPNAADRHGPQHDDEPGEPGRSGRRSRTCRTMPARQHRSGSRAAEQLRLRPGDCLAGAAHGAGPDSVLVLERHAATVRLTRELSGPIHPLAQSSLARIVRLC